MRRTFSILMMLGSLSLLAATPAPKPTVAPQTLVTPTPAPTFNPLGAKVTVIIFPFEAPTDVDPKTGANIAQIYQKVLTQQGGMTILPIPKDKITRAYYLGYARGQKADYYISGYLQPIGQSAAIVANVVDVSSGKAVYAATTQIESVQDVASQALNARAVIAQVSGLERDHIAATTSTPEPESSAGSQLNITNALSGLFRGKGKAKSTPAPTPTPIKPSRGILVNRLTGDAPLSDQAAGTSDLTLALAKSFNASMLKSPVANIPASADGICGANRNNAIVGGVLNATKQGRFHSYYSYSFKLDVYTCFGALFYTVTETDDNRAKAIGNAVEDYVKAHPNNQ